MRYAMIMAGGSGTRLWPMSRTTRPKQLIPFVQGKSLLELAFARFEGLLPAAQRYVCAGESLRQAIFAAVPQLGEEQFLGEPQGRDTLNAVGLAAAVLAARDAEAVIGVFTADHLIEPVAEFQRIISQGFELVDQRPDTLVTFGIAPTAAATGYGYLELGEPLAGSARVVARFHEKPVAAIAEEYFRAGAERYLWNSGMFVWRAETLLQCIRRFEPAIHEGLTRVARAWDTPARGAVLAEVYPHLKKISVDFAVMEPAARDAAVPVAAIPMRLRWLDVGSWPALAETCPRDAQGNALGAPRHVLAETADCLVASDDAEHLIAMVGCQDLLVIHSGNATLICHRAAAEKIKDLQKEIAARFGSRYV